MKKFQYFIPILFLVTIISSCKKVTNAFIDKSAPAPAMVSDIKVLATPGGASITYKIPSDPNLSYVKAVYEIQPGVFSEAKSSYYTDTLSLVGFGDTLSHSVKIYSVGRNEKESEATLVNVSPLTPPVNSVFRTLTLEATFGGVQVGFVNSTLANLAIVVMIDTTGQNTWAPVTTYYTSQSAGSFSARGFDSTEKRFAVFVRDRWNNLSDTLIKFLSPRYEQVIPKSAFKALHLPGDFWQPVSPQYPLESLWDNIVNVSSNLFVTADNVSLPQWFTVDMGLKAVFSRIQIYQRVNYAYNGAWPKSFAIWGSNDPDVDGGWTHWQKLGEFTSVKPSGLPDPQYTANDIAYVTAGENFTFEGILPAVRYIRFVMLDSRAGIGKYFFGEFTLWGQVIP